MSLAEFWRALLVWFIKPLRWLSVCTRGIRRIYYYTESATKPRKRERERETWVLNPTTGWRSIDPYRMKPGFLAHHRETVCLSFATNHQSSREQRRITISVSLSFCTALAWSGRKKKEKTREEERERERDRNCSVIDLWTGLGSLFAISRNLIHSPLPPPYPFPLELETLIASQGTILDDPRKRAWIHSKRAE